MRKAWILAGCLAASACSAPQKTASKTPKTATEAQPLTDAEKEAIVERVLAAQRAGFIDHDLARYMEVWDQDAKLIGGRTPGPDPFDWVLDREQIAASKRLLFSAPVNPSLRMEVQEAVVTGDSATAVLTWKLLDSFTEAAFLTGERYKLRNSASGWLITENRFWIVSGGPHGMLEEIDVSEYAEFDKAAAQETGMGRVHALNGARRYGEAYAWLQKEAPRDKEQWYFRSQLAQLNGDIEGAKTSVCMARSLPGSYPAPDWAAVISCPD